MIHGVGIDIVGLDKIRSICYRHKIRLKGNLFSGNELSDAVVDDSTEELTDEQIAILASKFAAKEAAVKAIGLPYNVSFEWSEIVVRGKEHVTVDTFANIGKFVGQVGIVRLTGIVSASSTHGMAIIIGETK